MRLSSNKRGGLTCCDAAMTASGRVSRGSPVHTAVRNCTRDEGRSFEVGNQVERRERVIAIWLGPTSNGRNLMFNGRRHPSCDGTSRMNREVQVRFCERLGVKFPGPTRQNEKPPFLGLCQLPPAADVPPHEAMCERCHKAAAKNPLLDRLVGAGDGISRLSGAG
jgi:hypothetical protein